jgi:hypothetical protein
MTIVLGQGTQSILVITGTRIERQEARGGFHRLQSGQYKVRSGMSQVPRELHLDGFAA